MQSALLMRVDVSKVPPHPLPVRATWECAALRPVPTVRRRSLCEVPVHVITDGQSLIT
ncbi:unnamed protein product [Staurois parvus]|uniref:Uncharacterized protein n=1 Tax=Staurois parvus TaxID=386267 RepID=A0ABN9DYV0_9NEOB|nr:unnamed protein product [Staurois parvus]